MTDPSLSYRHAAFSGLIGVSRHDITPPAGIYARNWGAAPHDTATGTHRPLTVTALALRARADDAPLLLLAVDLGWWRAAPDEEWVRGRVQQALHVAPERLLLCLSHTHAGPSLSRTDASRPGGDLVAPYLDGLVAALVAAARDAVAQSVEAVLTWAMGRSDLACNRDLVDGPSHVCGFNPAEPADDTLLVGRVTDADGRVVATLVNYACHPTTLAWENNLISPDFVGAMRALLEQETGAPCLFLQGASGDLAPRDQYSGETAVADANGRRLGYAALSTLEGMLPPRMHLAYAGAVESGARLGVWRLAPAQPPTLLHATRAEVTVDLQPQIGADDGRERWPDLEERVRQERLARARQIRAALGAGASATIPVTLWRIGDAVLVAQPNEAYSWLQRELRRRLAPRPVVVLNLAGGYGPGYLPPATLYDHDDIYPVWQTPFARGTLERVAEAALIALASATPDRHGADDGDRTQS